MTSNPKFCQLCNSGEWWHTASANNGADKATCLDSGIADIAEHSMWKNGPSYLKLSLSHRDSDVWKYKLIPEYETLKRFRCMIQTVQTSLIPDIIHLIDPLSTNSWDRLIPWTQFLLLPFCKKTNPNVSNGSITKCAKRLWFLSAMPATFSAFEACNLRELDI